MRGGEQWHCHPLAGDPILRRSLELYSNLTDREICNPLATAMIGDTVTAAPWPDDELCQLGLAEEISVVYDGRTGI